MQTKNQGFSEKKPWGDKGNSAAGALANAGLNALFGITSLTADNRNLNDVDEVIEHMTKTFEGHKTSTTQEIQLAIIPKIEKLTTQVSPNLPGLSLVREVGGNMYVGVALFSNDQLNIVSKNVTMFNPAEVPANAAYGNMVSTRLTPAQYINKEIKDNVEAFYGTGGRKVTVITMLVVDLEMYKHSEILDDKDRVRRISNMLAREWEQAILIEIPQEAVAANIKLASPFKTPDTPYGQHNTAEARVNVIEGRLNSGGQLSPANMEIVVTTANPNTMNAMNQPSAKEIARIRANVSLTAISYEHWVKNNPQMLQQGGYGMMLGEGYNGYYPLMPIITIDQVFAGEQLNYNQGLYAFFYGLYAAMTTNNNYVFADALRKPSVRGSLADVERRIEIMTSSSPQTAMALSARTPLDDKKMVDADLVSTWIKTNISKNAVFQVNIIRNGVDSALNNFLVKMIDVKHMKPVLDEHGVETYPLALRTIMSILNAMTGGSFGTKCAENKAAGKGWYPGKPILLQTNTIVANGLTHHKGKWINTLELDETMLGNIKGKNNQAMLNYLMLSHGRADSGNGKDRDSRCHRMGVQLQDGMFSERVHVNCYATPCILHPEFMSVLGSAMNAIGTMNTTGSYGTYKPDAAVFSPGIGMATTQSVGFDSFLNDISGFSSGSFY